MKSTIFLNTVCSRITVRDPFLAKWAVERIRDVRERSMEEADDLAQSLFDEDTVRALLTPATNDLLMVGLLRELPDDLLIPHLPPLADRWHELPYLCIGSVSRLLVKHLPDRATEIFLSYISGSDRHYDRMTHIMIAAGQLPPPQRKEVTEALMGLAFKANGKHPFDSPATFHLFNLAWQTGHSCYNDLLLSFAEVFPRETLDHLDRYQELLVEILMGETRPLNLITDYYEGYVIPAFSELPLFLPDGALGAELDEAVKRLGDFDYRHTADFYERHRQRLPERVRQALDLLLAEWLKLPELDSDDIENTSSLFVIFPACIAAAAWVAEPEAPVGDTGALLAYLETDLRNIPLSDTVISHFLAMDRHEAVTLLSERFEKNKDTFAALHLTEIMGRLGWCEFAPLLVRLLDTDFDELCQNIETALKRVGASALDVIIETLEADTEHGFFYLTSVLESIGGEKVADYLDRNLERLMREDKEWAMSLVEAVPEQRFTHRLAPLVGKGQYLIDEAWLLLNKLHGIASPEQDTIEKAWYAHEAENARMRDSFEDGDIAASVPSVLRLEMFCSVCGDVSRYKVKKVYISLSKTEELPYVADELKCIACDAGDSLEPTQQGAMAVTLEATRFSMISDKEARMRAMERSPVHILPTVTVMKKEMAIREGFALYQEKIAAEPGNAEYRIGLGNMFTFVDRKKQARVCYEEAVRMEPRLLEGCYQLAIMENENGHYQEAFLVLQQGVAKLPDVHFPHVDAARRSEFVNEYVSFYNGLKGYLKIPGPLIHHSMFGLPAKVGRNDPCTCGSGKKYKKCCGG